METNRHHNEPPEPIYDLEAIDPTSLLVVPVGKIAELLTVQYPDLTERKRALMERYHEWVDEHKSGGTVPVISNTEDQNAASDFYRQIATFAGDTGEVEHVRKKVKLAPYQACQAIDAWFKNLRDPAQNAMAAIGHAQDAWMQAELARERRERLERERLAREETERVRKAEEARVQAAIDAARAADDEELADEAIEVEDEAARRIEVAEEREAIFVSQARASVPDMIRTRSAIGTTTSAAGQWNYEVTDMRALLQAILAGDAPMDFVMVNERVVNAAIRGKAGRRACPGLDIRHEFKVRRTGA